jgi:hypothetical protein
MAPLAGVADLTTTQTTAARPVERAAACDRRA